MVFSIKIISVNTVQKYQIANFPSKLKCGTIQRFLSTLMSILFILFLGILLDIKIPAADDHWIKFLVQPWSLRDFGSLIPVWIKAIGCKGPAPTWEHESWTELQCWSPAQTSAALMLPQLLQTVHLKRLPASLPQTQHPSWTWMHHSCWDAHICCVLGCFEWYD